MKKVIRLNESDIQRIVKRVLNEGDDTPNMFCINLKETWGDKYDKMMGNILNTEKAYNTIEEICDSNMDEKEQQRLTSLYDPRN
jgi:hypothetical protein